MTRILDRIIVTTASIGFAFLLGIAIPNLHTALQRSKQKRTMADMHAFVKQIEKHQSHAVPRDGWGNAMQINIAGSHYSVRAAAADGKFETAHPRTPVATEGFAADILIVDGRYVQFPSGICAGDEPGKGPLGNCASCHPHRIAKAIGSPRHGARKTQHPHR